MPERVDEVNAAIAAIDVLERFETRSVASQLARLCRLLATQLGKSTLLQPHGLMTAARFEWEQPKHNAIAKAVFKDFGNYVQGVLRLS